ncbi:MAG: pyridoxamine 5'-phosphate oxidase family protein [Clostridiales bacterium]|jgi:uncharacterized pyridoxamine 5'-phosphate oxidase family protein|nr:pyridoxamine 5'-phosphate oxidase family protein [Clostridiales bacterium]
MEKVLKFLSETGMFFFGTTDKEQPEVRPFGFVMQIDGKLYFGMGKHKNVYKQLLENPKFVVCASKADEWLRIRATAGLEASEAAYKQAFASAPYLSMIYNEETKLVFALVEAKDAVVEFQTMAGIAETYPL